MKPVAGPRPALGQPCTFPDPIAPARALSSVTRALAPLDVDPALDAGGGEPGIAESGTRPRSAEPRLRRLREEHAELVWRTVRRFGVPESDADDATQEVFWVAAQKLAVIEEGKERAFLVGAAYRVAAHVRRARARRPEDPSDAVEPSDAAPNPEELCDQRRAREMLDTVLDAMPLDVRAVFVLFELEQLSLTEIASLLTLPRGTVASRLRRARELFEASVARLSARASAGRDPR